jgi:hypothetical protein
VLFTFLLTEVSSSYILKQVQDYLSRNDTSRTSHAAPSTPDPRARIPQADEPRLTLKGPPDAAGCLCLHYWLAGAASVAHSVVLVDRDEIRGASAERSRQHLGDARTISGVHHKLSVWTNKDAMRAYLTTGPHLEAMCLFPSIATGKVVGYQTDRIPDWSEINALWRDHGRNV